VIVRPTTRKEGLLQAAHACKSSKKILGFLLIA
jgi:hypothetical protein